LASAYLENSFGIFSGSFLFTKLWSETTQQTIDKPVAESLHRLVKNKLK
jgi:hypothetical protein